MVSSQNLLVLALCSLVVVQSHTWIGCTDYRADGSCGGFIRNYRGRNPPGTDSTDNFYTNKLLGAANDFLVCKADTQATPQYSAQFPRATARAGTTLRTMYTPNGHSVPDDVGSRTDARIHWNRGPNGPAGTLRTRGDLNAGNELSRTNYAANCKTTGDVASLPCVNPYTIPANTPAGVYQFVWYWPYNKNAAQRPFGEEYFSCFEVEVLAANGATPPPPTPPTPPTPVPGPGSSCSNPTNVGSGSGLIGQYFKGTNFNQFISQRTDRLVAFNYGFGAPEGVAGMPFDFWTIRWTGLVEPRFSGQWTFYTISDDGCRLWVQGRMLINDFTPHGRLQQSGQIALVAGQRVGLRLEYLEVDQTASINLQWSHQCQGQQDIPTSQMIPTTNIGFEEVCVEYEGTGTGLVATYTNEGETQPVVVQVEGPNDNREDTVPVNATANYKVSYSGFLFPSYSEVYTFFATSARGIKLTVNNVVLIENTVAHDYVENNGTVTLTSGVAVPFALEYWSNGIDKKNDVLLQWSTPKCLPVQLVPKNYFYTTLDQVPTKGGEDSTDLDIGSASALFSLLFVAILLIC